MQESGTVEQCLNARVLFGERCLSEGEREKVRNLAWNLDYFVLAAICCADDVVLAAAWVAAAEEMVAEVIAKLKEVGLAVGAEKTH